VLYQWFLVFSLGFRCTWISGFKGEAQRKIQSTSNQEFEQSYMSTECTGDKLILPWELVYY
jgi:hypothetical protein